MVRTTAIAGSNEVMAPFGETRQMIRGMRSTIRVTRVDDDLGIPEVVRLSLLGMEIPCIFTKQHLVKWFGRSFHAMLEGTRLAYMTDVIEVLRGAGKTEAADALAESTVEWDMYPFDPRFIEVVTA